MNRAQTAKRAEKLMAKLERGAGKTECDFITEGLAKSEPGYIGKKEAGEKRVEEWKLIPHEER